MGADEELQTRYTELSTRAEEAAWASRCEEEAVQAVSAELACLRSNQIITDGAFSNESATLKKVTADLEATTTKCERSCATLISEASQLTEITAKSAKLVSEAAEEQTMTRKVESLIMQEAEEIRISSESLASVKSEAISLGKARAHETGAVAELQTEIVAAAQNKSGSNLALRALEESSSSCEFEDMRKEIDALFRAQEELTAQRQAIHVQLTAANDRGSALKRSLKVKEEMRATQQKSHRSAIMQQTSDSKRRIAELNAALAAGQGRLEQDARSLDTTLQRIGSLQGELLCVEAASATEAEALIAVGRDKEAESIACREVQKRLVAAQCELSILEAQRQIAPSGGLSTSSSSTAMTAAVSATSDDSVLRSERVEADVLDAMARAARTLPGDVPGEPLAILGTPHFARQLLVAQALLEEWHQKELSHIREQGLAWRRSMEGQVAQQQTRRAAMEELRVSELGSWSVDKAELAKQLSSTEAKHAELESCLLGEIAQLEDGEAKEATSNGSIGLPHCEVMTADGVQAAAEENGSKLAEMNASLRDTHNALVQQQQRLEEVIRERDRLQAHLVRALERASGQQDGRKPAQPMPGPAPALSLPMAAVA